MAHDREQSTPPARAPASCAGFRQPRGRPYFWDLPSRPSPPEKASKWYAPPRRFNRCAFSAWLWRRRFLPSVGAANEIKMPLLLCRWAVPVAGCAAKPHLDSRGANPISARIRDNPFCHRPFDTLSPWERAGVRVRAGLRRPGGPSPYPSPGGRGNGVKSCCNKPFELNVAPMPAGRGGYVPGSNCWRVSAAALISSQSHHCGIVSTSAHSCAWSAKCALPGWPEAPSGTIQRERRQSAGSKM